MVLEGARNVVQGFEFPSIVPVGCCRRSKNYVTSEIWDSLGDFTWETIAFSYYVQNTLPYVYIWEDLCILSTVISSLLLFLVAGQCFAVSLKIYESLVLLARYTCFCSSVVWDLHMTRQMRPNSCLSQLHCCLGHGNLGAYSCVVGTFYGVHISLNDIIGLGYYMLEVVCLKPFLGIEWLFIVSEKI